MLAVWLLQNSHLELFRQKGAFKNFAKFTGKQLRQSLFLINLLSLRVTLLKKRDSGTGVSLWILKNTFFIEHLWWLLLLLIRRQSIRLFRIVAWCCVCFVFIFFLWMQKMPFFAIMKDAKGLKWYWVKVHQLLQEQSLSSEFTWNSWGYVIREYLCYFVRYSCLRYFYSEVKSENLYLEILISWISGVIS